MRKLQPKIVRDGTGRMCIQLLFGKEAATLALPFDYHGWTEERQREFCHNFVDTVTEYFAAMKRANYRHPEKFDRCSSPTEPSLKSEDETPHLRLLKSSSSN